MLLIPNISSYPLQTQTVIIEDGSSFTFTMYYVPLQYGWYITNLYYGDFVLNGLRITNHPNLLYQYQNVIPFGLGCYTDQNREPTQQQDFESGASGLYLLSKAEMNEYEDFVKGGEIPA